jgi:hypothetical protein
LVEAGRLRLAFVGQSIGPCSAHPKGALRIAGALCAGLTAIPLAVQGKLECNSIG